MKVKDIMRAPRAILSVETPAAEALARLHQPGVTSLPVVDRNGALLGLVTLDDLKPQQSGTAKASGSVEPYLSPHLVTATPEMDVSRVAEMMRYKGLENIMVVEERSLVGAFSLREATQAVDASTT